MRSVNVHPIPDEATRFSLELAEPARVVKVARFKRGDSWHGVLLVEEDKDAKRVTAIFAHVMIGDEFEPTWQYVGSYFGNGAYRRLVYRVLP